MSAPLYKNPASEIMEETIMSNENKELKNNELCEDKQEARQLTEEELAQVSGGRPRVIELPCEDPLWGVSAPAL